MPAPPKNYAGQLQDAKSEIAKLKAEVENLSKVDESLREAQIENVHLKEMLAQAKQAALANTGKARIGDLEKQVAELNAQLQRSQREHQQIAETVNAYEHQIAKASTMEQQVGNLQNNLRQAIEERDAWAGQVRNVKQHAAEQIANAENSKTRLNERLREVLNERNQYEVIVREIRSVLQGNPDVLAAVRQKVGLQN